MILIVSHPRDDHATAVLGALDRAGHPAVLLDTSQFPASTRLRAAFSDTGVELGITMHDSCEYTDLDRVGAAWWRRPLPYELHPDLDPACVPWTYQECHESMAGVLAASAGTWVNDPYRDERASHKPYQLALAARLGIPIPRTLITGDPGVARDFIESNGPGNTIFKTFRATEEHWRETRLVGEEELAQLDGLRHAPTIFQQRVEAIADLRITVVGDALFATEIGKRDGLYPHDYRLNMDAVTFVPVELPAGWVADLRRLTAALGLVYGAIDLLRRPDGTLVFLEINPSGEWLFVSERSGQPITEAVASLLCRLDAKESPCSDQPTMAVAAAP